MDEPEERPRGRVGRPPGSRQRKRGPQHPLNGVIDARQDFERARRTLYAQLAAFAVGRAAFADVRLELDAFNAASAAFTDRVEAAAGFDAATMPVETLGELVKSLGRAEPDEAA